MPWIQRASFLAPPHHVDEGILAAPSTPFAGKGDRPGRNPLLSATCGESDISGDIWQDIHILIRASVLKRGGAGAEAERPPASHRKWIRQSMNTPSLAHSCGGF